MGIIRQVIEKIYSSERLDLENFPLKISETFLCALSEEEKAAKGSHVKESIETYQKTHCSPLDTGLAKERRALMWQYAESRKDSLSYPLLDSDKTSLQEETELASQDQEVQQEFISKIKEVEQLLKSAEAVFTDPTLLEDVKGTLYKEHLVQAEFILLEAEDILSLELRDIGPQLYAVNAFLLANRLRLLINAKKEQLLTEPTIFDFYKKQSAIIDMATYWANINALNSTEVLRNSLEIFFNEDKITSKTEDEIPRGWFGGVING